MKKIFSALLAAILLLGCLSGITLAAGAEAVPVIATSNVATAVAAVIQNPAGKTPAVPQEYTKEMIQKIIQETALAYYYHDPHVQYDGNEVTDDNSLERHDDHGAPEDAGMDSPVYSVCSNFCWKAYENSFEHPLFRMSYARTRTWSDFDPAVTPELVYQYSGPDAKKSKGETDLQKALKESRKLLEPGDVIVGTSTTNGHAMLYVGDCIGDGKEYIIHCCGNSHDMETGEDKVETEGAIRMQLVDEICYQEKGTFYLGKPSMSDQGFAILRPIWDPEFPAKPTATGAARLQYPGLNTWRELDRLKFESALPGEEIPVYLTIANKGSTTLTEVPVEEYIPEGTTLVAGSASDGARVEGSTIRWAVKLPVGTEITLTYKVKLNGKLGDTVSFRGGLVGGIPSRSTTLTLGGKALTDAQYAAVKPYAQKLADEGVAGTFRDLDFFNEFYQGLFGVDLGLPKTTQELLKKIGKATITNLVPLEKVAMEDSVLESMILPLHFTGRTAESKDNWARTRDYKEEYYKPGDLFVCLSGNSRTKVRNVEDISLLVYMGENRVLEYSTTGAKVRAYNKIMNKALGYNVLIALRPTLAYADLMARTPGKMTFSDVKAADWFYSYVKDLVYDGAVNGMTATSFAPNGNLTYGQALKLITLAVGESEQAAVSGGHWASGYEKLAAAKGWIAGSVDLNKNITRLQLSQIAAKAAGITGAPAKNPFTDCSDAAVLALNNAGVINGMTATTFAPDSLLTRAQISKIIWCLREAM